MSAAPAVEVRAFSKDIPSGETSEGAWVPGFKVETLAGTAGLSFVEAQNRCQAQAMALCTDAQWTRACSADDAVGKLASWTITPQDAEGLVIRGGDQGCSARAAASIEASPTRVGVCCTRAVATTGPNKHSAFRSITTAKLLEWESAFNRHDLSGFVDTPVEFNGKRQTADDYLKTAGAYFRQKPEHWVLIDTCAVSLQQADDTWTADCAVTKYLDGKLFSVTDRTVWGGVSKRVKVIKELKATVVAEGVGAAKVSAALDTKPAADKPLDCKDAPPVGKKACGKTDISCVRDYLDEADRVKASDPCRAQGLAELACLSPGYLGTVDLLRCHNYGLRLSDQVAPRYNP